MSLPARVRLFEVGPRDGLQNEPRTVSVDDRAGYIERLAGAGLRDIEIGSFVRREWVPQMADTDALLPRLPRHEGLRYWSLVPNMRGFERAVQCGADHVAFLVSASEGHSRSNLNKPVAGAVAAVADLAGAAARAGLPWRGYVSVAFGCPYEGAVDFGRVLDLAGRLLELGACEVSLGDTIGAGKPGQVRDAARRVFDRFGNEKIAFHFHDTRGFGLTNAFVVAEEGALTLDGSAGGIGGCPYAPGAAGNVATEELAHMLDGLGVETGVDAHRVVGAARWLEGLTGIAPVSRFARFSTGSSHATTPADEGHPAEATRPDGEGRS